MKGGKRLAIHFILIALLGIAPLATVAVIGATQEPKYDTSFYGGLAIKDDRLKAVSNQKKIVFLGGSSLSFGLRSDMLSEALGYEVVDYGLYAPLGVKTMAELAKNEIHKDDIVIFAPEISTETYSTNMDYRMYWKCSETRSDLINRFSFNDRIDVLLNYPYFASERAVANVEAKAPYDRASFNVYGDIESDKVVHNVMPDLYDSGQMVTPSPTFINKDFSKYLNSYAKDMAKRGASTYFTFSPTNALALDEGHLGEFESALDKALDFKILGNVKQFTYHQNYFFDTNYHLNHAGTILHSKALYELLKEELKLTSTYTFNEEEMPIPVFNPDSSSSSSSSEVVSSSESSEEIVSSEETTFILTEEADGYYLSKVSPSLMTETIIRVPEEVDGHQILGIKRGAFDGFSKLKYVILPSTVNNLANGIFTGCDSLERIYLTNETAPDFVGNDFLEGCPESVRIYILRSARTSYSSGYTWINYKKYFSLFNLEDLENLS